MGRAVDWRCKRRFTRSATRCTRVSDQSGGSGCSTSQQESSPREDPKPSADTSFQDLMGSVSNAVAVMHDSPPTLSVNPSGKRCGTSECIDTPDVPVPKGSSGVSLVNQSLSGMLQCSGTWGRIRSTAQGTRKTAIAKTSGGASDGVWRARGGQKRRIRKSGFS
jgi:hypothetical protein